MSSDEKWMGVNLRAVPLSFRHPIHLEGEVEPLILLAVVVCDPTASNRRESL